MKVLVTGGAGYIGSHAVRALDAAGFEPVILDDLSQGHPESIQASHFVRGDIADRQCLAEILEGNNFQAVMHFAARCSVAESMEVPVLYYKTNLLASMTLIELMLEYGIPYFILSSTCSVYGEPKQLPLKEDHPTVPVNPYGESKLALERALGWYSRACPLQFVSLRYFNAAGASLDGVIGESHSPEHHLIPLVLEVARGVRESVMIFGDDYPTSDGTCIRDYIHVVDLADAHVTALQWLQEEDRSGIFNLGTGTGYSVREVIQSAGEVTGREISARVAERRPGDPPALVADNARAKEILGWSPRYSDLETIVETAWKWEQNRRY